MNATETQAQQMIGTIEEIAKRVGEKYGFDDVEAQYAPFNDFKFKWTRSYKWIKFDVSDYTRGASDEVVEGLFETIFQKMKGDEDARYPDAVTEHLTSEAFRTRNAPIYMRRARASPDDGRIMGALEGIRAKGLMQGMGDDGWDDRLSIGYITKRNPCSSVLMRAILIPETARDLSDGEFERMVWEQYAHVLMGFDPEGGRRIDEYQALVARYDEVTE